MWPLVLAVLAVAAFASATDGAFVYDDARQIAANPLIQTPGRVGEALASDVWAFRADAGQAGSNYWRPAFVGWLIVNERLFGMDPAGWHATSLLLHALVTLMAFFFLRRLGLDSRVAGVCGLLFAVHPVHVESVAWISGSPDLLLGVGVLGALMAVHAALRRPAWWRWALAVAGGVLAVASKEVGVMLPLLVLALVALFPPEADATVEGEATPKPKKGRAVLAAAPFAAVSAVYLVARQSVIGSFAQQGDWTHGPLEAALTAPAILTFYLRQTFLPFTLGPMYPLRPVTLETLTVTGFWLPVVVMLAAFGLAVWLARRGPVSAFGFAFFALLLLPAFNVTAFPPEHLVHDRYLYLPLLGALLMVVPPLAAWATRRMGTAAGAARVLAVAGVLAVPLLVVSWVYSEAWTGEEALWERAVETDPGSASSWTQYATALRDAGRPGPALEALDRSLALRPMAPALIERAELLLEVGRTDEAVQNLQTVIASSPGNPAPYERLALIQQGQGRVADAEVTLRRGREAAPGQACSFTTNLGVLLYVQGRRDEARAELERAAAQADRDPNAVCRTSVFHLGMFHAENGDPAAARALWTRYLALTEGFRDENSVQFRQAARERLGA